LRLVMKPGARTIDSSCKWTSRLDARFSNLADHGASRRGDGEEESHASAQN
jgi:hypothetical protein